MKIKYLIYTISIISLISCIPDGIEDKSFVGFQVNIVNLTDTEINNAKLLIGGLENSNFIETESISLPNLIIRPNESFSQVIALDENRWKPDFNLVSEISDKAYFAIKVENGNIYITKRGLTEENLTSEIIEQGKIRTSYGYKLSISVLENSSRGSLNTDF